MDALIELRRRLHAHPELSGDEAGTAARVVAFLEPLGPDRVLTGLGGHGVVATFDSGVPGPSILVRCELDALPIVELGPAGHRSRRPGVSHLCGHDGHMAMVCGLAGHLAARRPVRGAVHLLFQPAEETGSGAAAVLDDPAFAPIRPDVGIAVHNLPGSPLHAVMVKPGTFTPAVRSIVLRLGGRTAHASQPQLGENPSLAVAELIRAADELSLNDPSHDGFRLATCIHVRIGSPAYGVSAGEGELHLTLRAWTDDGLEALQAELVELAARLARRDGLELTWETLEDFRSNVNDPDLTAVVEQAARAAGLRVMTPLTPFEAGEDFGLFSSRFPCCMVALGSGGDSAPLHNPRYDFPDELIATGVRFYRAVVERLLARSGAASSGSWPDRERPGR